MNRVVAICRRERHGDLAAPRARRLFGTTTYRRRAVRSTQRRGAEQRLATPSRTVCRTMSEPPAADCTSRASRARADGAGAAACPPTSGRPHPHHPEDDQRGSRVARQPDDRRRHSREQRRLPGRSAMPWPRCRHSEPVTTAAVRRRARRPIARRHDHEVATSRPAPSAAASASRSSGTIPRGFGLAARARTSAPARRRTRRGPGRRRARRRGDRRPHRRSTRSPPSGGRGPRVRSRRPRRAAPVLRPHGRPAGTSSAPAAASSSARTMPSPARRAAPLQSSRIAPACARPNHRVGAGRTRRRRDLDGGAGRHRHLRRAAHATAPPPR